MSAIRLASALLAALLAAAPTVASAQAAGDPAPRRSVTLMLGGFGTDVSEGRTFGIAAARADWRLSRWLLAETGLSYARGEVEMANHSGGTPTFSMETTGLGTATVSVQAQLPLPYVQPYIGIATGLYLRLDKPGGHRFLSTTHEFPAGVRVPLTERLGARAEVRLRYDQQQFSGQELGAETTVGLRLRM
jgi:hypothetical protein